MNILLVNTNQISIRFVEELLAKNNIHGEIAMVRAGKFALDLVQGMHVDLLVCEIESETKEKTKHFLSESRKMTPDAYYFVLIDGESLEDMEEEFLNALDDFITIPFEDRALKLRLNRGILTCIEKKKKAGIVAGRPSARMAEVAPVNTVPVETGHVKRMNPEEPVRIPEHEAPPSLSTNEPAPAEDKDIGEGKFGAPGRRAPREEFQYEPSYEELLQQRNRNLRKEKEAAWLQAMSSQISSYALDEELEKPLRIREERKPDPMVPSSTESTRAIPTISEISAEPEPELPVHSEPVVPEPVKPVQKEAPSRKDLEPAVETQKAKSVVKSLFASLSKLKAKSSEPHLEPLLASSETGVDNTKPFGRDQGPHAEPSHAPSSQPPYGSPAGQHADVSEERISEPISGRVAEPSPESSPDLPLAPSADPAPDSEPQEEMGSGSGPDQEDPLLSDDRIPEETFLDPPVPDEEYVQEIPPLTPERQDQVVAEAVPEETLPILEVASPLPEEVSPLPEEVSPLPEEVSPLPERNPMEAPLTGFPADEPIPPDTSTVDDQTNGIQHLEGFEAREESTDPAKETHRFEEMQRPEEPVENLYTREVSPENIPVAEVSDEEPHEDEDKTSETVSASPDVSTKPLPNANFPSSGTGSPIEWKEDTAEKDAGGPGESQPSPRQVPHLQDEIWLDPTEPFIMEPDESIDDPDAPLMDLIEEVEIFGIEEDVDISLAAEEDPLLEEALVMPFEEDPWRVPETTSDPLQDSGDGMTFEGEESGDKEDLPMTSDDMTSTPRLNDESNHPVEGISVEERPDDRESGLNPLEQEDPVLPPENLEERIPEPVAPEPVNQDSSQQDPIPHDSTAEETPVPQKKESLDLRQYLKEPQEEDAKGLKSKFRKTFGKKSSS